MSLTNGSTPLHPAGPTTQALGQRLEASADRATSRAHGMIDRAREGSEQALDALSGGVDSVGHRLPDMISRMAGQVEDIARRGVERARDTSSQVRDQVAIASDRTVGRIQSDPLKAVLIAAGAGAALAWLLGAYAGRRRSHRDDFVRD
jgi:ElaB/YqjD/DUF883 family membrane-anchored ribosome-binding protein